jgi:signal transduction histidine kinase
MNRKKSLHVVMVLYVLIIMVFAGLLTSLFLLLVSATGIVPPYLLPPILSPLAALFISSVIGTSISAFASERVLKPLNQLIEATELVAKGDFSARVEESEGEWEMARLQRNFNHMAEELGGIELFRNDFIDDFSHELKTPIVSIRGFAKQLQDEGLSPEKRREYTDIIVSESERLAGMSTNILLLAQYEHQQIVTGQEEYELDEQLRNCVILLERQWGAKGIEMDLDLAPLRIYANAEMLSQLWINLLDNAIKYSYDKGRISVVCAEENGCIKIEIADEGAGMDESTARHAFDKFYRGETSGASRGYGLGLSIVKRIVELCHGTIGVRSAKGKGTSFTVRLPKADKARS